MKTTKTDNLIDRILAISIIVMSVIAVLFAVGAITVGIVTSPKFNQESYTNCIVEDKDRTATSSNNSDMRIYTTCGIFKVGDSLFLGKFDSADTYASIQEGNAYNITAGGYRIPLLSLFKVVVNINPA